MLLGLAAAAFLAGLVLWDMGEEDGAKEDSTSPSSSIEDGQLSEGLIMEKSIVSLLVNKKEWIVRDMIQDNPVHSGTQAEPLKQFNTYSS